MQAPGRAPRVALIHALVDSIAPVGDALSRAWPQCAPLNLLDDSLSRDLAQSGRPAAAFTSRFVALADYAVGAGAEGILFTCSAFGPCIEAVAKRHAHIPVLKPNEAMIEEAVQAGSRIGLVASFAPTLQSMPAEFPGAVEVVAVLAAGALEALQRGDCARHDDIAARAAASIAGRSDVIALAQFSLARAAAAVADATGLPVLTTPASAVRALRARIEPGERPRVARATTTNR